MSRLAVAPETIDCVVFTFTPSAVVSAQKSDCTGVPVDKFAVLPSRSVYVKSDKDGSVF